MQQHPPKITLEAHRGGRGIMPENTIEAMKNAITLKNVTTLEMDLCITKDKQVVVSHDVYFHSAITTTPEGGYLTPEESKSRLLYSMTYDSIRKYDVGLKPHPDFPAQKKMAAIKPLLSQLLDETEAFSAKKGRQMYYNMEVKSKESGDGKEHPEPGEFTELIISLLKKKNVLSRTIIQSFDIRPLQVIHRSHPDVKLSLLVGLKAAPVEQEIKRLGFKPDTYSPDYRTVTEEMVAYCHNNGIKVLPWTPNTLHEIQNLINLGVDGIISDFPELFKDVKLTTSNLEGLNK